MAEIKISELEPTTDLEGLYTIGSDKNNLSKKVSLQFLREAADYAIEQGDYAKQEGSTIESRITDFKAETDAKLTELESETSTLTRKTSAISQDNAGSDIESIEMYDDNKLIHKIDKESADFKNLKNNGIPVQEQIKDLAEIRENSAQGREAFGLLDTKQDSIKSIEQLKEYEIKDNSIEIYDGDDVILKITPSYIGANTFADLNGNSAADGYLFKNGILYYQFLNIGWQNPYSRQYSKILTTHLVQNYPLRCIEGHKYTLDFGKGDSKVLFVQVDFGTSVSALKDDAVGDLPSTAEMNTGRGDISFVVPRGAKYFRIHFLSGNNDILLNEEDIDNNLIVLADVSPKSINETAELVYPLSYDKEIDNDHYCQGLAIQNGYIFLAYADGVIDVIDFDTKNKVDSIKVDKPSNEKYIHLNNMCFGAKYEENDEFGVLFISSISTSGSIIGLRIIKDGITFSAYNLYEIPVPLVPNTQEALVEYFDFANKRIICYSPNKGVSRASSTQGDQKFYVFNYDGELNNETTFSLAYYWDFPQTYPGQGGLVIDNMLYFCVGTAVHCSRIYVFNVISGMLEKVIDLRGLRYGIGADEIQDLCIYEGSVFVNFVHGIYKLNN